MSGAGASAAGLSGRGSRWSFGALPTSLALALVASLGVGCSGGTGDAPVGAPCQDASECQHGLCVGGASGESPVCTRSCAATSECPRGWACSGVTANNVLICTEGAPTPFGVGARE